MTDMSDLDDIAFNWGCRAFGRDHMTNTPLRALRFAEEAVEVCQAIGLPKDKLHDLVDIVYGRERGDIGKELGGAILTLRMLCRASFGQATTFSPEALFVKEIHRVLASPPEKFAARNQEKLDLGLDAK